MAIRFTMVALADAHCDEDAIETLAHKRLLQFYHMGEKKADFFGHFGCKECFQYFGLGTNDKYRRMHVASKMFAASNIFLRCFGLNPTYIKGEASNTFSQRVYEHDGFEFLHEEFYADWEIDGERPLADTGEHKKIRYYGLKAAPIV